MLQPDSPNTSLQGRNHASMKFKNSNSPYFKPFFYWRNFCRNFEHFPFVQNIWLSNLVRTIECVQWSAVNFINVLRTAFTHADPECAKRQSSQQCRLALLGPTSVKAVRRTMMKLTPGVNFINILRAFAPVDPKSVKRYWQLRSMGIKAVRKYVGEIEPRWAWQDALRWIIKNGFFILSASPRETMHLNLLPISLTQWFSTRVSRNICVSNA